jgi:uncharacterized protein (AIM24 family)
LATKQIASAVAATGAQTTFKNGVSGIKPEGLLQVEITGVATCVLEGSLDGGTTWAPLSDDITASGFHAVMFAHSYRLNVTAYTSGAVNAWVTTMEV